MLTKILCLCAVLFSSATLAACGGAGWKVYSEDKRLSAANQRLLLEDIKVEFDTSFIDKNCNRLGLNEKQMAALQGAIDSIRNSLSMNRRVLNESRTNFRNCIGDCPEELRRLKAAYDTMKHEDPDQEFTARLSTLFRHDQVQTLERLKKDAALAEKAKAPPVPAAPVAPAAPAPEAPVPASTSAVKPNPASKVAPVEAGEFSSAQ